MPLGITSKLYINNGTYLAPDWIELFQVSDVTPSSSWNRGDASVRVPRVQASEPTNLVMELTGRIRKNVNNQGYNLLLQAHLMTLVVDMLMLDGPLDVNGSEGRRFDGKIFDFSEPQGLQDVTFNEFTIVPCISDHLPQRVIVAGGVPVYTPMAV